MGKVQRAERGHGKGGMDKQETEIDTSTNLLEIAQQAVNQGDVVEMLRALTESRYLDGLARRLQKEWGGSLPATEVDDCIAQAVDAATAAVFEGRTIRSLGAWLWKSARNIAVDKWRSDYAERVDFNDNTVPGTPVSLETHRERERHRELEDTRRIEAIRIARELLPRVGEGQVLDVMKLVIDAAEDRLPDLPASSIADALGISKNAARTLVSRGMKRLRRLAEQEGVEALADLPEMDTDAEEEEHNDA